MLSFLLPRKIDDNIYWQNGTYAVLTKLNFQNIKLVGGKKKPFLKQSIRETLANAWSIYNRNDAIQTIESLKSGMHSAPFLDNVNELNIKNYEYREDFIKNELNKYPEDIHKSILHIYDIWHKNKLQKNNVKEEDIIFAWDLCRAVYICHTGYLANYFTYQEALDKGLEICLLLQSKFNSWEEMFFSYLYGYFFWSEEPIPKDIDKHYRVKAYYKVKNQKDSPYNLDWKMKLNKTW